MNAPKLLLITLSLAAVLTLTSCATGSDTGETPVEAPPTQNAEVGVVVDGLDDPWSVAFHGDTALVSERDSARILELYGKGGAREVAVIAGVQPAGEGGMLGIAVQEDYLYAYSTASGENRIERYRLSGEPGSLALGTPETILDGIPSANYHDGGRIAFGPDGMLYATAGDAGDRPSAQDLDSLAGKILRMTPDGDVPADNPFQGSYVYSYGHRNPQGIAWTEDGTMYASEFGQDTWDELNLIEAGRNYGWPEVEGIAGEDSEDGYVDPVQ